MVNYPNTIDSWGLRGQRLEQDSIETESRGTGEIVTWGLIALGCWALAVLAANLGAIVPPTVYAALHASRADGGTVSQLRASILTLEAESGRLRVQNTQLLQRLALGEDNTADLTKRVAAVEGSLPRIIEAQSRLANTVDGTLTGSVAPDGTETIEADGGTVVVQKVPMVLSAPTRTDLPMPQPLSAPAHDTSPIDGKAFGLALDGWIAPNQAATRWISLQGDAGTMLVGLTPLLTEPDATGRVRILAGPVFDQSIAADLCKRLGQKNISCDTVPFKGVRLVAADN